MKTKYAQWNAELQARLRDFREQKRNWTIEVAALQASDTQHKVRSEIHCLIQILVFSVNRHRSRLKENYSGVQTGKYLN
jgi:hypothetical protein